MFQVFASTPEDMGPGRDGAHAARAEAMGFDGLQVPDAIHDGLLLAALALNATSSLIVGTAVIGGFRAQPDDHGDRGLGFAGHVRRAL